MNPLDYTVNQLKRAAAIKEQIENLSKELRAILGGSVKSGATSKKNRVVSSSTKKKIAFAQKARWAKLRRAKPPTRSGRPAANPKKKTMSPAARAKVAARMKAYWAAKKAGKK